MLFKTAILCLVVLGLSHFTIAQTHSQADIADIIESLDRNLDESIDYTELLERLTYYKAHPLNINQAGAEELKDLVLLTPLQINSLLVHILENGPLLDILELQSIENFDLATIQLLLPFIRLGTLNPFKGFKMTNLFSGNHDLMLRYQQILEKQEGFKISDDPTSRYLGSPQKLLFRYRYHYQNHLSGSLNFEKDPGERLFKEQPGGFDFGSGYLALKDIGHLHKLVIGDYDLQFGQGLALWSGLSFGKSTLINSIAKQDVGLKPYSSLNEAMFFRGIAASLNFKSFLFTPFYSYRKLDASLTDNFEVTSINLSGLHRTPGEMEGRHNLGQSVLGANLKWRSSPLHLGLTAYHTQFNRTFEPGQYLYNQFEFSGQKLYNYSFDYNYTFRNSYFFGEAAKSLGSDVAIIAGLISSLSPKVSLGLLYRNYPANYHSFYNSGLSEAGSAVNERGFYTGITLKPNAKWEWSFYADVFRFPWLKYGVDAPSKGFEILNQLIYKPHKRLQLTGLYKISQKEENHDLVNAISYLQTILHHKARIDLSYWVNKSVQIRNRVEMAKYNSERGFMMYQDFIWNPVQSRLSGNFRWALFNIPSYDSRIYAFQNDVLYSYSILAYQNKGVQFYCNGRYTLSKGLDVWLNYNLQQYVNQENIGSGLSQISGNKRSEIKVQIRYQF